MQLQTINTNLNLNTPFILDKQIQHQLMKAHNLLIILVLFLWPTRVSNTCTSQFNAYCINCNTATCTLCSFGYSPDSTGSCRTCTAIMTGCASCNFTSVPQKCLTCTSGMVINASSQCQACANVISNCMYCTNATICTWCLNYYYGLSNISLCEPCPNLIPHCLICYSYNYCYSCQAGSIPLNGSTVCTLCSDLMPYCSTCLTTTTCISCNHSTLGVNFTAFPDICVECNLYDAQCQECTLFSYCVKCVSNSFTLSYNSSQKQTCVVCEKLLLGCLTCSSNTSCLSCIDNNTFLYNSSMKYCKYCSYFIPYCATCSPNYTCLTCFTNQYFISPNGTCQLCDSFMQFCGICNSSSICTYCNRGKLSPDYTGCTKIIGCASVDPLSPISNNCQTCDTVQFLPVPQFGRCTCTKGWLVGAHCTTVVGCTATNLVANVSVCISCSSVKHFILKGVTCVCDPHYTSTVSTCIETCGDGYVVNAECDDGNLVSGDGCSSTCQIEDSYQCLNDNSRTPSSKCQFRAKIQLQLVSILKASAPSTVQVTYDITPYSDSVKKINLLSSITLNAYGCSLKEAQVVEGQLLITIQYNKNIQNQEAEIILNFDHEYVVSPNAKLHFKMVQSQGFSLSNDPSFQFDTSSSPVILILSLFSLCVFGLGSLSFKMIGVETIYTVQISWLFMNTSKYFKTFFVSFSQLNYSYGQLPITSDGKILKNQFGNLGFTSNINDNYMLYAIFNGLILTIYVCALAYKFIISQQLLSRSEKIMSKGSSKDKILNQATARLEKVNKFLRIFYNCILFPFFIGFFLHLLHTLYANQYNNEYSDQTPVYYALPILMAIIATSFIFHFQLFNLNSKVQQATILKKDSHRGYIAYFLVHNFAVFILLSIRMIKNYEVLCFITIGLILMHLIYLVVKRPYLKKIDNFAIIFNQLAILFTFGWILAKGSFIDTQQVSTACFYSFLGIFYSVNILGAVRSAINIKEAYDEMMADEKRPVKKKPFTARDIQQENNEMASFPKKRKEIQQAMINLKPTFPQMSMQSPFLKDLGKNRNLKNKLLSVKESFDKS